MPACKPITLLKDGEQHTFESEKQARDAYKDLKLTDFQLQRIKGGGSFEGISVVSTEVRDLTMSYFGRHGTAAYRNVS